MCLRIIISITISFALTTTIIAQTTTQKAELILQEKETSKLTSEEEREVRYIAAQFSKRFQESRDLSIVVKDLFLDDFIERHIKAMTLICSDHEMCRLYFLPMVEFDKRLFTEANSEEWRRFYVSSVSLLNFGTLYMLSKKSITSITESPDEIAPNAIYPQRVITLINQNPLLRNFIMRKNAGTVIKTVKDLRSILSTFEQALVIMREEFAKKPPEKTKDYKQLAKAITESELSKPKIEVSYAEDFGFMKGTKIISVFTLAMLQIFIVKTDKGMKIALAALPID